MPTRKFLAESALILGSERLAFTSTSGIKIIRDNQFLREDVEGTNIYVIAKRRKIRLHQPSLRDDTYCLRGDFRVSAKDGSELIPFEYRPVDGKRISAFELRENPEQKIGLLYGDYSHESYPIFSFIQMCAVDLDPYLNLEVLYIGQAFGKTGKRLAVDRLSNHRALKRIQNDISEREPENEVFVLMYRYGTQKNFMSTEGDPNLIPQASAQEESDNFRRMMKQSVDRRLRIYLTEAALIRYFRPHYNEIFKKTFPSRKHLIVRKALEFGYSALAVEIDSTLIKSQLWTPTLSKPNTAILNPFIQFAQYSLCSDQDRETFLSGPI